MTLRITLVLFVLLSVTACSHWQADSLPFFQEQALSRKLDDAREALRGRQFSRAAALLSEIAAAPAKPGITDEALLHLALLQLRSGQEAQALRSLEHLAKRFPGSHWTILAAPAAELINRNQALGRDNASLRQNIQKIKELELELEKKPVH